MRNGKRNKWNGYGGKSKMPTVRDVISRVRITNKLLSSDNIISDRAVAAELKSKAIMLIRRETNLRRLWATSTIFNEIPCLEMEPVPLASCCEYKSDMMISRSKYKLPQISEGIYGYLIQSVMNVEKRKEFNYVPLNEYLNYLKIYPDFRKPVFWINDRYVYVSDPEALVISISAYFEDDIPKNLLFPDCVCNAKKPPYDECKNPLDLQFKCPGFLEDNCVSMTAKYLLETYFRLEDDKTSDNKDDEKPR